MLGITYEIWTDICQMYFSESNNVHKSYLQWYPFSKLTDEDKDFLLSERFYNYYIKNNYFAFIESAMYHDENYIQKADTSFRNSKLVSPILFLIIQCIGKIVYDSCYYYRSEDIDVYYAGNYESGDCRYKKEYDEFFKEINYEKENYEYFIKTDIKEFFNNINLNNLIKKISDNLIDNGIKQYQLLMYKELLTYCGDGRYPTIDNSMALSFLATVVYLEDIDIELYDYFNNTLEYIDDFKMIRYVDDLYILVTFKEGFNQYTKAKNEIKNKYSSILKKYGLALNTSKFCLKESSQISEELKQSFYFEHLFNQRFNFEEICESNFQQFLVNLYRLVTTDNLNHDEYEKLIDNNFYINGLEFLPNEIFNYYIYQNDEVFKNYTIIQLITRITNADPSFISIDPKRLTLMIIKTENGHIIRKVLANLFERRRLGLWNDYDTTIALNYLIQRNFEHPDLLKVLCSTNSKLYTYYYDFCKNSFCNYYRKNIDRIGIHNIIDEDQKTVYLYFMYKIELNKNNIMSAYAFYKNYFDRVSAIIAFQSGYDTDCKKPNFNKYYKEQTIAKLYSNIANSKEIINKAHAIRNENPITHASARLIEKESNSDDIINCIRNLEKLIEDKIDSVFI